MKTRVLYSTLLTFFVISITWLSCKKNIKDEPVAPTTPAFPIPAATTVTGSVHGVVVDENNTPVSGAEVKLGANNIITGTNGSFLFKNVSLDKYISTVTINKTGYFKGIRSFSANATLNYVSIKLIPKTLAGTVSSNNPTVISLSNGTTIALQSNSIVVKSTGAAYTGQVKVYASYIDPTSTDMSTMVPGSLMGEDATNLYVLQSTGMIAVDLESPTGEALQLVSGMPASIKMPIPSSLQSKAPPTIDTWSLDDRGVWIKEGTATKNGNAYDMQVTHFSFWNCDVSANSTFLDIQVQDQNGNALANALVSLTVNNNSWLSTTYGLTDSLGNISGVIPANVELEMGIAADPYNCNVAAFTQTIGPFTTNSSITVTPTFSSSNSIQTISGSALDCSHQPLANGTAILKLGYQTYYTMITNGHYSMDILHCSALNILEVKVIDLASGFSGHRDPLPISGDTVIIGAMNSCSSAESSAYSFYNGQGSACSAFNINGQYLAGVPLTGANSVAISVHVYAPGTYYIITPSVNGVSFSAYGSFTNTGLYNLNLAATGTPVNPGTFTYQIYHAGYGGCTFPIIVN